MLRSDVMTGAFLGRFSAVPSFLPLKPSGMAWHGRHVVFRISDDLYTFIPYITLVGDAYSRDSL
jgi:hypothetical protein